MTKRSISLCLRATAFWVSFILSGCAVGPDFKTPAAPDVSGYTKEPLADPASSTLAPIDAQRFVEAIPRR